MGVEGRLNLLLDSDQRELDKADISNVVKWGIKGLNACYFEALEHEASLAGGLSIEVTVVAGATVSDLQVEDAVGSASLLGCVKSRVRSWRVPKSRCYLITERCYRECFTKIIVTLI